MGFQSSICRHHFLTSGSHTELFMWGHSLINATAFFKINLLLILAIKSIGQHVIYVTSNPFKVYKNGFLTFNWPLFPSSPPTLPANIDIVAPLWTDIDNSDVYFQEFKGVRVLQRVTNDIRQYFPNTNFTADSVFACTWENVTYFNTSAQVRFVTLFAFTCLVIMR